MNSSTRASRKSAAVEATLRLEHPLRFAPHERSNRLIRVASPTLDKIGLTYPPYLVMVMVMMMVMMLWQHASCMVSPIGDQLLLDSGTLTALLKHLRASDPIVHTRDERCMRITLSGKGRIIKRNASKVPALMRFQTALPVPALEKLREDPQTLINVVQPAPDN